MNTMRGDSNSMTTETDLYVLDEGVEQSMTAKQRDLWEAEGLIVNCPDCDNGVYHFSLNSGLSDVDDIEVHDVTPMKHVTVIYELTQAYEEWTVEVPERLTDEQVSNYIKAGNVEFICMEESGNNMMTPVEVDGEDIR